MGRVMQVEVIVYKKVDDEILFLLLKRNVQKGGFWQPVTGGVHDGESLTHAANRELLEETGISEYRQLIDNVHYFEFDTAEHGILKEYVFGVEVTRNTEVKLSPEHVEMKWCSLENSLLLLKYESNKVGFKKLFSLLTA